MVPDHSSTEGIQISMAKFDQVEYDKSSKTVTVGAGCLWDEVYSAMTPYKRNVVGGAAAQGVGVAGWMLGGGYSLKTNQYGLGIDNVVKFEIVTGNGRIRTCTEKKRSDLFQALRVCIVSHTSNIIESLTNENCVGRRKQLRYCNKVYVEDSSSARYLRVSDFVSLLQVF